MISIDIYAFALVLVAASCVVAVWRTFYLQKKVQVLGSSTAEQHDRCVKALRVIETRLTKLEQQSAVALGARVDELSEAVERLRKTHQRFAGRYDQEQGGRRREPDDSEGVDNAQWHALRRAQQANQGPPNGGST